MEEWIVASEEAKERIEKGIEQNRKGSFRIFAPEGATVQVRLKRHRFRFGCNLFMLDEFPDDPGKNAIYREKFVGMFNLATLPFYWDATEPREGALRYAIGSEPCYRRPPVDLCMQYCEENGIEPREHALCYEKFFPEWLKDRSVPEIKRHLERRMQEISERYADRIPTIEVTNEMFWDEGTTPFYSSPDYAEFCFRLAEKYFPHNQLCINEWTRATWGSSGLPWCQYRLLIDDLLLRGARIDAIGMQYHMFFRREEAFEKTRRPYDLDHDLRVMDSYAAFGKPLQITEVTIPAYTGQAEDEELQADILERLYSMWFSHPMTEQIIYWNLVDGYAAFTTPGDMNGGENYYRGGLLRFDMSEKPAYKRLRHLIQEVWTTNETLTVKNGCAEFRGFYGDYEVTVNGKTKVVRLDSNGAEATV